MPDIFTLHDIALPPSETELHAGSFAPTTAIDASKDPQSCTTMTGKGKRLTEAEM
jgi:hypothetical protein